MGIRDFLRRGEKSSDVDMPRKTQDQLRVIVERRRALMDHVASLPGGKISIAIPLGMDHPETAEDIVINKKFYPITDVPSIDGILFAHEKRISV